MSREFPDPTPADIAAVTTAFRPLLEPDASLGEWAGGEDTGTGAITMPWFSFSGTLNEWHRAVYEHNIICPYGEPGWSEQMEAFQNSPQLLALEDLVTVRKVITTIVRGERFCDGYIKDMYDAGVLQAAMTRLADFA